MNRIWLATILGLILGAILYGMLSSGRDAGAAPDLRATSPADVIRRQVAPTQTTRPPTARRFPEPINEPRYLASAPRTSGAASNAETTRERIRAQQRQIAEERRRRLEANAAGGPTTVTAQRETDARRQVIEERLAAFADARQQRTEAQQERMRQLQENRRRRLELQGGGLDPAAVRMAEAADARDAFRDQLADGDRRAGDDRPNAADSESQTESDSGLGAGEEDVTTGAADDEPGQRRGPGNEPLVDGQVPAGLGGFSVSLSGVGNSGFPGGDTDADDGDSGGSDDSDSGGGTTDPGAGDDGDAGGDTPPPPPPGPEPLVVTAQWAPVPRAAGECPELAGTVTNDLFLATSRPVLVTVVNSLPTLGLQVAGGEFVQAAGGGNTPPTAAQAQADPCLEFDSFVALGDSAVSLAPGAPAPTAWGSALQATWFGVPGAASAPIVDRFGDATPRLRVGRFTITGNPQRVSGALTISFVDPATGQSGTTTVAVPDCADCWATDEAPVPTDPKLVDFRFATPTVLAGAGVRVDFVLDRPAVEPAEIAILSSSPSLIVPSSVTIGEGGQEVFQVFTTDPTISEREEVVVTALFDGTVLRATLTIDPRTPGDLSGDGTVDGADLGRLLGLWGSGDPLADLNGDGTVDGADLGLLLGKWTPSDDPAPTGDVVAKWIAAPIEADCAVQLAGMRSNDLYLGFNDPIIARATVLRSRVENGLRVPGGEFYQAELLNSNGPPSAGALAFDPCVRYDSYLTLANARPTFIDTLDPDWGSQLVAEWFTLAFDFIQIEQNAAKFGDSRFYLRVGRFTAPVGTGVTGTLGVIYSPQSGAQQNEAVVVPNDPDAWGDLDLNDDGLINAADVDLLAAAIEAGDEAGDLDGSGDADAADLRIMLDAAARQAG